MVLDEKGFDHWAKVYDESIDPHEEDYPFAGYYDVLHYVQSLIPFEGNLSLLDLGVGTGSLTEVLYKRGCQITGIDFSAAMLKKAEEKMPGASFYHFDLGKGLPADLRSKHFDFILSSYTLHHFTLPQQVELIENLVQKNLAKGGTMVVADIAFATWSEHEECKRKAGDFWDDEEYYLVFEEIITPLEKAGLVFKYTQISHCGAVLEVKKP